MTEPDRLQRVTRSGPAFRRVFLRASEPAGVPAGVRGLEGAAGRLSSPSKKCFESEAGSDSGPPVAHDEPLPLQAG